jgi:membrane protein DedA with SNARE-associated domain
LGPSLEDFLFGLDPFYAYLILFLGSLVEGESVVLSAGFLSYTGMLSFPLIVAISFTASVCADQIFFFIGRRYGTSIIDRFPSLHKPSQKAFRLLHKYNVLFIMGFRFVYGVRTISPLIIGASGIGVRRFVILNIISGFFWAVVSCGAGYMLGYFFADTIKEAFAKLHHYQVVFFSCLAGLIVLVLTMKYFRYKKEKAMAEALHPPDASKKDAEPS